MSQPDYAVRLSRAKERVDFLLERIERWRKKQPYPFAWEKDSVTGHEVLRCRAWEGPPERLGLDAGECLFYLRSSLDYIAYQLQPSRDDDPVRSKRTEFPIFGNRPPSDEDWRKKIGDASDEAQVIIRSVQPFASQDYTVHPLWVLHELNNFDKHRKLTPVAVATRIVGLEEVNTKVIHARFASGGPLIEGREVIRVKYEAIDPAKPGYLNLTISANAGFADTPVAAMDPIGDWLNYIHEFIVSNVVAPLRPYL